MEKITQMVDRMNGTELFFAALMVIAVLVLLFVLIGMGVANLKVWHDKYRRPRPVVPMNRFKRDAEEADLRDAINSLIIVISAGTIVITGLFFYTAA